MSTAFAIGWHWLQRMPLGGIPYLKKYKEILTSLFKFYHNNSVRRVREGFFRNEKTKTPSKQAENNNFRLPNAHFA